ncbi:hypothetical protein SLV14_003578 [Streptomyces sp. Je 1-4]|uniref:hypothetical protein n=1 Tax=Streptomyces TaxID=1883 RepID=UPI0021DB3FDA|nr:MULTISPECIES: hypothetical protein [unclassified Streptomyces]UYB40901.1 hypothetical protein SLV14_003578 [Streptomyces sp. Je 1-4]UZQ37060.1 hypothetical protein SLV14N_003578 [Streptomyces sp. Je 1-4] [Streptomyces sp. Je 1-4 4N24]UZQ44477.1 hypothetical protein SLV14NA_003578 [Streptomyces sp. Je 1-4] [Streptomyces sp. Je 1-4 4N24_ara]
MTDHTGRVGLEKDELYAVAHEFDKLRTEISVPGTPRELPDLATASKHLATLTGLIKDLSDEVVFRVTENEPGLDLKPVIYAYTSAASLAGQATENYTEAYIQLGFLHRYADAPETKELRDARHAAFLIAQERTGTVRNDLTDAARGLRRSADRLDGTPPRTLAALSRSARPTNSIYRLPPQTPTPSTTRLAYTPAPRHAR